MAKPAISSSCKHAAVAPSVLGVLSDLTGVATTIAVVGVAALTTIPLARVIQVTAARTAPAV